MMNRRFRFMIVIVLLLIAGGIEEWRTQTNLATESPPPVEKNTSAPATLRGNRAAPRSLVPHVRPYIMPKRVAPPATAIQPEVNFSMPYSAGAYGVPPLPHVITYTVQAGDTLSDIALRYGITLDSLRWSNPDIAYNPDDLYIGQSLRIPPLNGVVVTVKKGDTVERLARTYNVDPEAIRTYAPNHLKPPYTLKPGQVLIIPGGSRDITLPPPRPYPGYAYMWPVRGIITQRFSKYHNGLDIATVYNAGVYAARAGRVRVAHWDNTGYGNMIIIDHGNGWSTLYAHLKGFLVRPGQWVNQGDLIARVGGTGRATGPHVHFEIRKGRVRYDPQKFLPPSP